MTEVLWNPSPERSRSSHMGRFMATAPDSPATYEALWHWSIDQRGAFWQAVWDYCGVTASVAPTAALAGEAMPGTEWFPGARLNFAENLLSRADDGAAIVHAGEDRPPAAVSWSELRRRVAAVQAGLVRLGVGPGDRVAALLTNGVEAVVGMLAAAAIGAVWSSCSPDFGPTGVVDRFGQIEPSVLIAVDGYHYNGKPHPVADTVLAALDQIDAEHLVVVDVLGQGIDAPGAISWADLEAGDELEPSFAQLPFDHPLYILYSSGTTGAPKSIVHGAGGTLLKHLSEHQLHCDVWRDDRVFWFTTCGWMMWNWLVSALASKAAVVLYDGSPSHPSLDTLWRLADGAGITHFGTSPKFLAANANAGLRPAAEAGLESVRWIGSTGAPLNPEQFDWVYDNVKDDVHLASVSGGTDLIGCFAAGVPTLPVRRGELQGPALGMAVESWNESGEPVTGVKGELVCTRPFVSMPVSFWRDPSGERYRQAYFEENPGVWTHGDFIEITEGGGVIIYGRSDTTLNPGGVRIGTAEIYRAVEPLAEIDDAIVVGREADGDVEVVLFVKPAPGSVVGDTLVGKIKSTIRTQASPRHVPARVVAVDDIPYTLSGKKVEKAVRKILAGEPVENRDALANPESLDLYEGILDG